MFCLVYINESFGDSDEVMCT